MGLTKKKVLLIIGISILAFLVIPIIFINTPFFKMQKQKGNLQDLAFYLGWIPIEYTIKIKSNTTWECSYNGLLEEGEFDGINDTNYRCNDLSLDVRVSKNTTGGYVKVKLIALGIVFDSKSTNVISEELHVTGSNLVIAICLFIGFGLGSGFTISNN